MPKIAEMFSCHGHQFPRHPGRPVGFPSDQKRYHDVIQALEFARSAMGPADRALYVELTKCQAWAMSLHADQKRYSTMATCPFAWANEPEGPSTS